MLMTCTVIICNNNNKDSNKDSNKKYMLMMIMIMINVGDNKSMIIVINYKRGFVI